MKKQIFNLNRTALLAIVFIALGSAVMAQDSTRLVTLKASAQAAYTEAWDKLSANLGLTSDQVTQWKALNQADLKQANAILTDPSLTNDQKKSQLDALHTQQQTSLQSILSPDQYSRWNTEKAAAMQNAQAKASAAKTTAQDKAQDVRANRTAVRQARRN